MGLEALQTLLIVSKKFKASREKRIYIYIYIEKDGVLLIMIELFLIIFLAVMVLFDKKLPSRLRFT
jgi:hypothetical protein